MTQRGIDFHLYPKESDAIERNTKLQQLRDVLEPTSTDGAPLVGVEDAWNAIRAFNKEGVVPWVFVDPHDAEINHNGSIQVHGTEEDAKVAYEESCDGI
jgi:hypothetical protein